MNLIVGQIVALIVTLSLIFHFCIVLLHVGLLVVGDGSTPQNGRAALFLSVSPALFKNLGIAMAIFAFASTSPGVAVLAVVLIGVGLVFSVGKTTTLPRIERASLYSAILSLGSLNVFYLAIR